MRSAKEFRAALKAADMTEARLGRLVGRHRNTINQLKNHPETRSTTPRVAALIERELGLEPGQLFELEAGEVPYTLEAEEAALMNSDAAALKERILTTYTASFARRFDVSLHGAFPMSPEDWEQLQPTLHAMRSTLGSSLVTPSPRPDEGVGRRDTPEAVTRTD